MTPLPEPLDVGAGRGRVSLPLAVSGHELTAVEPDAGMADGFEEEAARLGVSARLVRGRWPEVAGQVPQVDVVMSANVVYDVAEIGPFVAALDDTARRGVVIEMTERHPRVNIAPLFRAVHGVDRPDGPSVDHLVDVVVEEIGVRPEVEHWERPVLLLVRELGRDHRLLREAGDLAAGPALGAAAPPGTPGHRGGRPPVCRETHGPAQYPLVAPETIRATRESGPGVQSVVDTETSLVTVDCQELLNQESPRLTVCDVMGRQTRLCRLSNRAHAIRPISYLGRYACRVDEPIVRFG